MDRLQHLIDASESTETERDGVLADATSLPVPIETFLATMRDAIEMTTAAESAIEQVSQRPQVWLQAWCAVAAAVTCPKHEVAASWADACLKAFDERFPSARTGGQA
jgi:hypothetical protein